jgi:hypothetical protein
MTRMTLTLAVALATGFTGAAVHAIPGDLTRPADQNGDGTVTVAEAKAEVSARLRRIDADGNGVLTRAEFRAYREQARNGRRSQRFEAIDADRDGRITQSEWIAHQHAMVDRHGGKALCGAGYRRQWRGVARGVRGGTRAPAAGAQERPSHPGRSRR